MSKSLLNEEQDLYLRSIVSGRLTSEITDLMNDKFNLSLTPNQIKGYKIRNNIKSNVNTRFKKGELTDYNKNKMKEAGGEFLSKKDGYYYTKNDEGEWVKKQRYVYEKYHNVKLPTNISVVFLDGNKNNFDIDNLMAIDMRDKLVMKNLHLFGSSKEITETGLLISKVINKASDKRKDMI